MKRKKIYVFGNPLVEKDSLALKVAAELRGKAPGFQFVAVQSLDEVKEREELLIMDVALGIKKVELIDSMGKLHALQPVSSHDFDLALELKVMQKIGKLGKVRIIAIPEWLGLEDAVEEVEELLLEI